MKLLVLLAVLCAAAQASTSHLHHDQGANISIIKHRPDFTKVYNISSTNYAFVYTRYHIIRCSECLVRCYVSPVLYLN